ncbi:head GIN domain-containing protein [[Empedobacter] haloabium]|uniref:Head GIN domain-containing protein n=1 Tax=[Empedobacter] haloabium TaxID=592317 RepID=A0ABZ1UU02_9BURK
MRLRTLVKIALSLLALAFVLVGVSYSMLRAQGVANPSSTAGRVTRTETREIGNGIRAIDLEGPIDLTVRQGGVPKLKVRGEQRLLGNVVTQQEGGTLRIGTTGMVFHHRRPLQVELELPSLAEVTVRGNGDSSVQGFSGERLQLAMNGSGSLSFNGRYRHVKAAVRGSGTLDVKAGNSEDVELEMVGSGTIASSGSCRKLSAGISGSGDIDAEHMACDDAIVKIHGSGSTRAFARKSAVVSVAGSGDATVYGNPDERVVSRTGSGSVDFE